MLFGLAACSNQITGSDAAGKAALVDAKIAAAADGDHRSEKNRARNAYRHPVQTLAFFGLRDDMTVIEISPGGLWYSEILAPVLKDNGQFIAAGYDVAVPGQPAYRYKQTEAMLQRFANEPEHFGNARVVPFSPPLSGSLGLDASADMVLTFRNSHGWMRDGIAGQVYRAAFDVLKPGGVFGVVQHRGENRWLANTGSDSDRKISGYLPQSAVIAAAESVGFVLEATSEINANPKDSKDHPSGVWTLPPSLRLKEVDKEKYLAIGESDRMTLRFRKP
ncbi:MAG: class I SAM-dependent methyltransferase [Pseudomonadales bacterium]|nr:class I SAM-dependent methyltransferase [Pseudomonadales bacterium]